MYIRARTPPAGPSLSLSLLHMHALYALYTDIKLFLKAKEKRSFNKCFHLCFLFSKISTVNKCNTYIQNKIVLDILKICSKILRYFPCMISIMKNFAFLLLVSPNLFLHNDDYIDFVIGKNNFIIKVIKIHHPEVLLYFGMLLLKGSFWHMGRMFKDLKTSHAVL